MRESVAPSMLFWNTAARKRRLKLRCGVWNGGGFVGPTLPGPLTLLSKNLLVIELSLLSDCSRRGHFWDASQQLVLSGPGAADDTTRSGQPASARSLASLRGLASGCVFW